MELLFPDEGNIINFSLQLEHQSISPDFNESQRKGLYFVM